MKKIITVLLVLLFSFGVVGTAFTSGDRCDGSSPDGSKYFSSYSHDSCIPDDCKDSYSSDCKDGSSSYSSSYDSSKDGYTSYDSSKDGSSSYHN
jgi:hypothetical protein